ncbi:MAG: fructose-6-phosphate aldolase [Methanomassiliicoccales archaeon]|uniref:fructose-6-phosphate aldolase n=1 Tax=Candidatus Methanarcanum hacksteinii TaxID=2911857 RepID=UPI00270D5E65|nr:fructose-6-phosphate aldolase [Methanomassiliicoccales archaeon]MDD7479241.1 fructose-6-phosphate aldolase [Methanomassiliicoccales archaeon]MDO5837256.1 fructose-6-phosphate aldolase [Methanomassiliicoccales archaeon]MDY4580588.1 fructose-6-phosphate aldolase [Candidatus Methanarcanum hacksteinii]TQS77918.1 MAG: fructose-6-phosphate aldolase [Candidatus Methanarcanum hacksteinii]
MKIFIDTANLDQIKEINSWGIVDGVTTNPSLIAKEGVDVKTRIKEIAEIVDGPISAEAMSMTADEMVKEGRELAKIHPNVVIKLPMCIETLKATSKLREEGIRVNVTLIFSAQQALLAAKAGAAYVSPFVGRLDDIGEYGTDLISNIVQIYSNYDFDTEIIAASIRHPVHVLDVSLAGCDIATIPYDVLKKMVSHPKTDEGIQKFIADYEKSKKQ